MSQTALRWVRFSAAAKRHAALQRDSNGYWLPLCGATPEKAYSTGRTVGVDEACNECRVLANKLLADKPS